MANMRTTVGQPYSQQAIEEDSRNLYSAGDITNVRIFAEPAQGGLKVVVVVQTRPVVKEVRFEGMEKLKPRSLTKQITTEAGKSLNEEVLEQDRQKIVEYYQGKGYSDIGVQYKVIPDERLGKACCLLLS